MSARLRVAVLLAAWLALPAAAAAPPALGRLFATPAERAEMESHRGSSAALMPQTGAEAEAAFGAAGTPPAAQAPAGAAPAAPPPPPPTLVMNGVLRSSSGDSTVWLNNVPQRGAQNHFANRGGSALTVTLPSGKRIVLKPGQRYDLGEGRIKDVNEP
ncbi:hypothetical protein [Duganella violaceipulchra]|uniref:MSHA biogenesis protein MshK n=1 Tax=Duganella violaceipulchra TaxID=2849652 RepID=A0AA41H9X2_9BURK|nr:hypothetical protein [Duganella violaceicalia]MBV6323384.1 hypothetical protein [Duganella violaceicalia]MCP2007662.1 hypothetical protein [Duganella violaceicalia]